MSKCVNATQFWRGSVNVEKLKDWKIEFSRFWISTSSFKLSASSFRLLVSPFYLIIFCSYEK